MPKRPVTPETFWSRFDKTGSCWLWTGARISKGYGTVKLQRRSKLTHRVAWEWTYGPIPQGLWVLHRCDQPACGRPEHLFLGTHADNERDKAQKGRHAQGERNGLAVLTASDVIEIRARRAAGELYRTIAKAFNITPTTACRIYRRRAWVHVG